jgi:formate-dependent nitrite reductase membrane component NrfD
VIFRISYIKMIPSKRVDLLGLVVGVVALLALNIDLGKFHTYTHIWFLYIYVYRSTMKTGNTETGIYSMQI